jgi:hypothetical protein
VKCAAVAEDRQTVIAMQKTMRVQRFRQDDAALPATNRIGAGNGVALWPDRHMTLYVALDSSVIGTRMHFGHAQYLPMAPSLFALLAVALGILLILVQIRVLRYAYLQLGVSSGAAFFLLFGSLFGSYVNIPIATLGEETMVTQREVTYFGMRYIVPKLVVAPEVILAVNVGGAVIPTLLSIYLLSKNGLRCKFKE